MTAPASPFAPPPGGHFIYPAGEKPLYVMYADEWAAQEIARAKASGQRIPFEAVKTTPHQYPDSIAIWAFRYCLGRASYAVGDCIDWLRSVWNRLQPNTRTVILRDIQEAVDRNEVGIKPYRMAWLRFAKEMQAETSDIRLAQEWLSEAVPDSSLTIGTHPRDPAMFATIGTYGAVFDPPPGGHFVELPNGRRLYITSADEWAAREVRLAKASSTGAEGGKPETGKEAVRSKAEDLSVMLHEGATTLLGADEETAKCFARRGTLKTLHLLGVWPICEECFTGDNVRSIPMVGFLCTKCAPDMKIVRPDSEGHAKGSDGGTQ